MSSEHADIQALVKLLRPAVATNLHGWRIVLTSAGALLAKGNPEPGDLLGFFADQPLHLKSAEQAQSAVQYTASTITATRRRLDDGASLLALAPPPPAGRGYALALADAIFGFADGMDFAEIDPDELPENGALLFEALGRRAVAVEALADILPDQVEDPEVLQELEELAALTDQDVASLYALCTAPHETSAV